MKKLAELKPHLRKMGAAWICVSVGPSIFCEGIGDSPVTAYSNWRRNITGRHEQLMERIRRCRQYPAPLVRMTVPAEMKSTKWWAFWR